MTQKDLNRTNMWRIVFAVLMANESVWTGNARFSGKVQALGILIDSSDEAARKQVKTSLGVTADKGSLVENAIAKTLIVTKVAMAFAIENRDHTLMNSLAGSKGILVHVPHDELEARLSSMLAAAVKIPSAIIAEYGLPATSIADAVEAIEAFNTAKPTTRKAIVEHKTVTDSLPQIMRDGRQTLLILDHLIHLFDDSDPVFVSHYKNARVTLNSGVRHENKVVQPNVK